MNKCKLLNLNKFDVKHGKNYYKKKKKPKTDDYILHQSSLHSFEDFWKSAEQRVPGCLLNPFLFLLGIQLEYFS